MQTVVSTADTQSDMQARYQRASVLMQADSGARQLALSITLTVTLTVTVR